MAFKTLLKLAQRRPGRDRAPVAGPADVPAVAFDDASWGPPPVLRPAAIFRQLLFDPAEAAPVWARPRSAPVPDPTGSSGRTVDGPAVGKSKAAGKTRVVRAASTPEPTPTKGTRRPKASGTTTSAASAASRTRSKRVAKPGIDATQG